MLTATPAGLGSTLLCPRIASSTGVGANLKT